MRRWQWMISAACALRRKSSENTDFLAQIIAPVDGMGGITFSHVCPCCLMTTFGEYRRDTETATTERRGIATGGARFLEANTNGERQTECWWNRPVPLPMKRKVESARQLLRCWEVRLLCESQAARRCTRLALFLEPVPASVAPTCPSHHLAHSHQGALYDPAILSTLPQYLQSWLHFCTT